MDAKREHRTHVEGSPRENPYDLTYSPSGRMTTKYCDNGSVTMVKTVDMAYGYCDKYQPQAVRRMYDHHTHRHFDLRWDPAGNLGQVSATGKDALFETGRFLFWTEDSRMHAAADDRYYSYYAYDHGGERRLKLSGDNKTMDVNARYMATYAFLDNPTLYPSAYLVLTLHGYTNVAKVECRASLFALPRRSNVTVRKHYYAGAERVAARLGGGGLDALCHVIGIDDDIQKKANVLFDQSLEQVNSRILQDNDLDCVIECKFAIEEFGHKIDGIPRHLQAKVEVSDGGKLRAMVDDWSQDHNGGREDDVYFYHSDHLGSASWITERHGDAVQHLQYLPYGEPYINQHPFGYSERFTFTGKERDEETGYGYFGARYMDHELMTMWLSVDPMSDKYPSISPYAYCAWNPVKLVDPDGRDWYQSEDGSAVCWRKGNAESFTSNNVKYNRIGETYDKVVDNITYHYNQNDLETIHFSTGTQFQKQSQNDNCKATADAMVKSSGANPMSGRSGEILMANHDANGVATTPTGNLQTGVNRINGYMEIGHAVTVGVDYKPEQKHNFAPKGDGMTDHFIAIVGMTYNCKTGEMTYNFFDPGSKTGNSPSLIIRQQDGFLQGNLAFNNKPFKVTTVRKNK